MTPTLEELISPISGKTLAHINLPDGNIAPITHFGFVSLTNNLKLHNVLCVPKFRFKLLSVSKLMQDNDCFVLFYPKLCLIQDFATIRLRGIGK